MKKFLVLFILVFTFSLHAFDMENLVERKELKAKIAQQLLKLDVSLNVDIANIDLIDGINLSSKYRYDVEPSYQDKYFTRIDKWDLNAQVNPGALLKDVVELPFSFGISRNNSFLFVRQFNSQRKALDAIPYTPQKLPITANRALKLNIGDFVSIPANLNLAFGVGASTSYVLEPAILKASINGFFVVSGEFTIQVFKLDETHVRLKLISNRAFNVGTSGSLGADVNFAGFKIFADPVNVDVAGSSVGVGAKVDDLLKKQTLHLVDRIIDREFINYGINYSPGASYIADYVFDLSDNDSISAYNQILSSAYKLKDILVIDHFLDARTLQDKLLTTTYLADKLVERDRNLPVEQRKVSRVFKGFNNYKATNRHIKLGILFASYQHNTSYVENKLTFVDKNNHSLEFFYPTFSKYWETNFGKWIFNLKDQSNKTYFGLIPKKDEENIDSKNPDLGLTFERKDKIFSHLEQKHVTQFMINQLPESMIEKLNLSAWKDGTKKLDSRIYFQVVLKSQGFNYLRTYNQNEITIRLIDYLKKKRLLHIITDPESIDTGVEQNNNEDENSSEKSDTTYNPIKISQNLVENTQIKMISSVLYHALNDSTNVSESTLTKLLKLNEIPLFCNVGMGFLISLLPEDSLNEFTYAKIEMIARDIEEVKSEFGELNYKVLYNEINTIQSRLSNRSYDLRITKDDIEIENTDTEKLNKSDEVTQN